MKELSKKLSAFFHRYINGIKGAISLLLALLMTPMLSISLLLVQSARYQSVVETMEEIADICGFSTLGNYDSYLQSRFGLFSVDQEKLTNDIFNQYMTENIQMLGNSATLSGGTKASGVFPLSNDQILRQQIVEQGEISVISKTVYEGLDIDKIVEKFEEMLNLDGLTKQMEAINAGADVANTIADLVDGATKVKEAYDEYDKALKAYNEAYEHIDKDTNETSGFLPDAQEYIQALKTAEANLMEEEKTEDVYDDKDVKDAASELKSSTKDYYEKTDLLKSALKTLRDETASFQTSLNSLPDKVLTLKSANSKADGNKFFDATTTNWVTGIASEVINRVASVVGDDFVDEVQKDMDAFSNQITNLKELEKVDCKTIKSSWTTTSIKDEYGLHNVSSIKQNFGTAVQSVFNALNQEVEEEPMSIGYLMEVVDKLLNIQGVYDASLNAAVSETYLFTTSETGLTDTLLMESIDTLCDAIQAFRDAREEEGLSKVWEYIKAVGQVLLAIGEFLLSIITFAGELLVGVALLAEIFVNPGEVYNDLLMYGWAAYNMPNRLTCTSDKSLTGYSYQSVFLQNGGILSDYDDGVLGGSLGAEMTSNGGSDPAFKGAVQEYLMVGSLSEYQNQSICFIKLYLFRLVLNLYQIFTNSELTAMAAPAGPFAIVIKILVGLAEPMLDTVFLVNGEKAPLVKQTLFLTPSGIDDLCKKLATIATGNALDTLISNDMKKDMESKKTTTQTGSTGSTGSAGSTANTGSTGSTGSANSGSNDNKKDDPEDFLECTYGDHLYLMSFLMCDDEEYMKRIQNVIQMEAAQYYKNNGSYTFKLENANTYLKIDLEYQVNPIFSFDVLPNGGVFKVDTERFIGY